jgi:DNA-binding transcriptional LysR family regulator
MAEDAIKAAGLARDIAVTVPTFTAAAMVAATTDLVAAMPRRVAETFTEAAAIRIVEGPGPPLRFAMHLLWHERTHLDPVSACLRDVITRALGAQRAI